MNYVTRNNEGKILIYATVLKAVLAQLQEPGRFKIKDIQQRINNELDDRHEFLTYNETRRTIVLIMSRKEKTK